MRIDERSCSLLVKWRRSLRSEVCRKVLGRVLGSFGRIDVEMLCQKMPLMLELMLREFAEVVGNTPSTPWYLLLGGA